jgi:uncharacterized protein YutE (UPF0331/DUF86 family)
MRAFEPASVEPRLQRIVRELEAIRKERPATVEEFESEDQLRHALEHRLMLACQAALDIAAHLAVRAGPPGPSSHADAIRSLGDLGVVPASLADRLVDLVGMRNALAHDYLDVDAGRVFAALYELEPIEQLVTSVVDWIDARDDAPEPRGP